MQIKSARSNKIHDDVDAAITWSWLFMIAKQIVTNQFLSSFLPLSDVGIEKSYWMTRSKKREAELEEDRQSSIEVQTRIKVKRWSIKTPTLSSFIRTNPRWWMEGQNIFPIITFCMFLAQLCLFFQSPIILLGSHHIIPLIFMNILTSHKHAYPFKFLHLDNKLKFIGLISCLRIFHSRGWEK